MAVPSFAFPRQSRLTKTDEFSSVFSLRKRVSGHFVAIHYRIMPVNSGTRIGIVVSKKIAKRAVDRNYMKRVVRELFRTWQHKQIDLDLVVRMQRRFQHGDFAHVTKEFGQLLDRLPKRSAS